MAIRYENRCVDCKSMGMPCHGSSCPNRNVPIHYCDDCEDEDVELFEFEGKELCIDCIKGYLTRIE